MMYENNDVYMGDWKAGLRDGRGTMFYGTGEAFTGLWKNGQQALGLVKKPGQPVTRFSLSSM